MYNAPHHSYIRDITSAWSEALTDVCMCMHVIHTVSFCKVSAYDNDKAHACCVYTKVMHDSVEL